MAVAGRTARLVLFGIIAIYLILPIIAVVLYAFATRWTANILPDGYTLQHWQNILSNERFFLSLLRTLGLALLVTLLDIILVVPAAYWQRVHNPRIRVFLELAAAIPFVLPYVVIAFGILRISGQYVPSLQGTVWLLGLGHVAISFPFLYWAVDSSMTAANVPKLNEAAQTCGANAFQILWRVVLPNIGPGIASGSMLVFATSFGEFALVQILVGNRFETISLYSLDLLRGANANYNGLAVITCITFIIVFAISAFSAYSSRGQTSRVLPGSQTNERKE